jgi:hypothetical protein
MFSVMTLDGRLFYFTSAASITQVLEADTVSKEIKERE